MKLGNLGLLVGTLAILATSSVLAAPTREELYRNDKLNTIVYKDGEDQNVFWYLPPIKLYEDKGKVVYYRRPGKDDKVTYYFYIVPFMNDQLMNLLAGEVPGLQSRTQLKPVIAKQFGLQIKQFDAVVQGDAITNYVYLNKPQLIKMVLPTATADEFEFFLNNKPGIQANVLIAYDAEKEDKYLKIELSYKEVYDALNIGATGQYTFTKAEISDAITNYVGKKYLTIKSKGDIPIPDIVNKAIEECFTPYKKPITNNGKNGSTNYPPDWWDAGNLMSSDVTTTPKPSKAEAEAAWDSQAEKHLLLATGWDPTDDSPWGTGKGNTTTTTGGTTGTGKTTTTPGSTNTTSTSDDFPGWPGSPGPGTTRPGGPSGSSGNSLSFTFKKEMSNSEKSFYYNQQHFVDSTEIASVPVYLSLLPSEVKTEVQVAPLETQKFVVEASNEQMSAMSTGIMVTDDVQYIINAAFAIQAKSPYDSSKRWYRWDKEWPNVDGQLYYRIGTGQWNPVNGRTQIKTDVIDRGELQFYLDRKGIWSKVPADYKDAKLWGVIPAIFTYANTFPQFNVVVTGRRVTASGEAPYTSP